MTFENPGFLWASFAVAIPIIIHLFNFRRPKKVLFSDISMVKEVQRSVVRRIRLKQWLLLATRILAILALVFLFARPIRIQSNANLKKGGKKAVAVVIDNSYSMSASSDGEFWTRARKLSSEILNAYSRNDEFLVMTTSDLRLHYNFNDRETAIADLKEVKLRQSNTSLTELLALSPEIFSKSGESSKVLYFISDFQESTILSDSGYKGLKDSTISINLIPLSSRRLKNVFVQGSELISKIIEKDKPVLFKATVVNEGEEAVKNLGVRVNLGSDPRPVATLDLEPGEKKEVEFNLTPKTAGWLSGWIELDNDPITFDNKRFFSFYVPEKEKTLVVEEQPAPHLKLMLGGQLLTQQEVTFLNYRNFSTADLGEYQSIILAGFTEISSVMQERLLQHLREGKSILFFPGDGMKKENINAFLSALKVGTFADEIKTEKGLPAANADLQHPLFDGMFVKGPGNRKFDGPILYRNFKFSPSNAVEQTVILRSANQDPVLVESRPEGGLFYLFTFFPGPSWTDFTLKSSGLAMMVQLTMLMNQSSQSGQVQSLGNLQPMKVKTKDAEVVKMVGDDGRELIPEWYVQSGGIVVKFDNPELKEGNYSIIQKDELLKKVSFNVPDAESMMKSADPVALQAWIDAHRITTATITPGKEEDLNKSIEQNEKGVPLWKYFLIAALLFFICEYLIVKFVDKPTPVHE